MVGLVGLLTFGGLLWGLDRPISAQAQTTQAVTWYQQWRRAYLGGKTQKYVKTNDGQGATQVLSEGQGYGMLATVLAAKRGVKSQTTFNQLYRYYRAHRIATDNPLMSWRQTRRGGQLTSVGSERNSATDGDLDIAYALILADRQWGSRRVNYRQAAQRLLAAIARHELNPTTKLPFMGNWATTAYDRSKLRTSDLMTGYFKTFAKFTHQHVWTQAAQRSQRLVSRLSARHPTGLFPDFIRVSGTQLALTNVHPGEIESATDNQVGYNACRVPWRLAQTYRMTHDATTKRALTKQLTFFKHRSRITSGYTLGGHAVNNYTNPAFNAPINAAARTLKMSGLRRKTARQLPAKITKHTYYSSTLQVVTALS